MKPYCDKLIIWTCRIVGWSATLTLSVYIAVNFNGISVRGQISRLSTPFENLEAMKTLLDMYGDAPMIPKLVNLRPAYPTFDPGPWYTLRRSPIALVIEDDQRKFVLVFDSDGRRVGNPITPSASEEDSYDLSWVDVGAHNESHFLLLYECSFSRDSSTATSGPLTMSLTFHVMQIDNGGAQEVFVLKAHATSLKENILMSIESDGGNLRLLLFHMLRTPSGWSSQTDVEFEWDAATGQFVGPPGDPDGWWQVLQPAPKGHTP